jgi:hypothetical protein
MSSTWQLTPAGDLDVLSWSYGDVTDVPSLYSPRTFGPRQNYRCECGKYAGEAYENIICDECGVKIFANAAAVRRERCGHVNLACPCEHPISQQTIEVFPVAPIAYRTGSDGAPNALSIKYERFLAANVRLNHDRLSAVARDILLGAGTDRPDPDSILGLIFQAIAAADPCLASLVRCFGYALKLDATI